MSSRSVRPSSRIIRPAT
ncbi:MAG: hypothetical protein ACOC45_07835 [Alkalispirochaetaceae bacterium]